jgi:hypothetical protein
MSILAVPIYDQIRDVPKIDQTTKESIRLLYTVLEERNISGEFTLRVYYDSLIGTEAIAISTVVGTTEKDEFRIALYGRENLIKLAADRAKANDQKVLILRIKQIRDAQW